MGQGSVRRDAVRDRADKRVDRRRAGESDNTATLYVALAREILAVAARAAMQRRSVRWIRSARVLAVGARPARPSASLDELVAHNRRSAKTHSGIWRDLAVRKRPTEVDAQLGIVVDIGRAEGVPTPLTTRLVGLIHDIENGVRSQSLATLDALLAP